MTKSSTILTLLGVAALLWGAFALLGGGPAPAPPAPLSVEEPVAAAEAEVVEDAAPVAAEASWSPGGEDEEVDEPEREEALLEVERSPRFVLQVWDRKRGQQAAEAEVFVLQG